MTEMRDTWGNITTKLVLPDPVNPPDSLCYVVPVPNSKFHITAFLGAIYDLSLWFNWQRDEAKTASEVAQVWRKIWYSLRTQPCNIPVLHGTEVDLGSSLRIDCNCNVFITCCDGTEVQLATVKMLNQPSQPGAGAPQPKPGGGQQAYQGCLEVQSTWLLPTNVSTGDTISLEGSSGAWNDPDFDGPAWRCPTGDIFFLGNCNPGTTVLVGTDPLPTAPHMGFVLLIAGVYYDFSSGSFTVPGGVSHQQVTLLANDSNRADDNGQVCFTLNVVNNQAATWMHDFDFTANSFGSFWAEAHQAGLTTPQALYVAGQGWSSTHVVETAAPTHEYRILLLKTSRAMTLTRLRATFAIVAGAFAPSVPGDSYAWIDSGGVGHDATALPAIATSPDDFTGSVVTTSIELDLTAGTSNGGGDPGGSCVLSHLHLEGIGPDPFV